MIRLLLVDDHALVRTGFRFLLEKQPNIQIIGEATNGKEAITLALDLKPDVILMDIHLPDISGIEATQHILERLPKTNIVAVTVQDEQPFSQQLFQIGAAGYITKACPFNELLEAIYTTARGDRYLSSDIAKRIALQNHAPNRGLSPFEQLSARELEITLQIVKGLDMSEIATQLHLSVKTVATYKYRVYQKLGVSNEVKLTYLASQYGLIRLPATQPKMRKLKSVKIKPHHFMEPHKKPQSRSAIKHA